MHTRHPDEETLFAFTDGQLPPQEADGIAQHVEACTDCAALVAEARGVTASASRIVGALDGVPANVIPARSPRRLPPWLLAAAVVVLAVGVSSVVVRDAEEMSQSPESLAVEHAEETAAVADVSMPAVAAPEKATVANSSAPARVREPQPAPPVRERTEAIAQAGAGAAAERQRFADGAVPSGPAPPPPVAADMAAAGAAARESAPAIMQTSGSITPLRITKYRVNPEVVIEVREFGVEPPTTALPAGSAEFRWRDPAGSRVYVLTGPLPAAELEALARRLGELAIVR